MSSRAQALVGTIMSLALIVHIALSMAFHLMASATPDVTSGRTWSWPFFSRSHQLTFITQDQYWALAVTLGLVVGGLLLLMFAPMPYRELGDD